MNVHKSMAHLKYYCVASHAATVKPVYYGHLETTIRALILLVN